MVGRFYLVGILIGLTAGSIAAFVAAGLGGFLLGVVSVDLGQDFAESTPFAIMVLVASSIGFIVSGFVTARSSPGDWIYNAGATGFILTILSTAGFADTEIMNFPFWFDVALFLLAIPLALVGGHLHFRRLDSHHQQAGS